MMEKGRDGSAYGIDLTSTQIQPMSQVKPTHAVLQDTVYGWLRGTTIYVYSEGFRQLTYGDFADHIGCDASEYFFSTRDNARVYTWIASDKPNAKFSVYFRADPEGRWTVYASGSVQIRMPDDFIDSLRPK